MRAIPAFFLAMTLASAACAGSEVEESPDPSKEDFGYWVTKVECDLVEKHFIDGVPEGALLSFQATLGEPTPDCRGIEFGQQRGECTLRDFRMVEAEVVMEIGAYSTTTQAQLYKVHRTGAYEQAMGSISVDGHKGALRILQTNGEITASLFPVGCSDANCEGSPFLAYAGYSCHDLSE